MTRSRSFPFHVAAPLALAAALVAGPFARAAYPPPFRALRFAVATDEEQASRAAATVMRAGGNAVDGAIAASLALGVVNPASSGFGGGGFATICSPRGDCTFLDFRETAPAAITAAAIAHAPDPAHASQLGGLAVGVPGEPSGLLTLSHRFGRAPFARVVAPAVGLARNGFRASEFLVVRGVEERANFASDGNLSALLLPAGRAIEAGDRVRRTRLAAALERYGREREAFVNGALARAIASAVREHGGVLTEGDIRDYRPLERAPLSRPFRGYVVVTAPPPSAGGIVVLETLALVDRQPAASLAHGSSAYDHALVEAFRGAFDDRARYLGDPGNGPSNADALLDPGRLARRAAAFDPAHARPVTVIDPARDHGTTHICVVDADGMVVSLTTTVNTILGARFTVPDMDIVLNNEIDDFSIPTPGNSYGMAPSPYNTLAPGRRPVSSMAPTIVMRDGRPVGCVGGAGGPRIATATAQVLLNMVLHGMDPEAAVSSPRVHHQGTPDELLVDAEVPEDVRTALSARGHRVVQTTTPLAAVQAIWIHDENGSRVVLAASDPRRRGQATGE